MLKSFRTFFAEATLVTGRDSNFKKEIVRCCIVEMPGYTAYPSLSRQSHQSYNSSAIFLTFVLQGIETL